MNRPPGELLDWLPQIQVVVDLQKHQTDLSIFMTCMSEETKTNARDANFRAKSYQGGLPSKVPHRADRPRQLRCQCAPHQRLTVVCGVAIRLALAAVTFFVDGHDPVDQRPGPPPSASNIISKERSLSRTKPNGTAAKEQNEMGGGKQKMQTNMSKHVTDMS
jgi:hypothetical protein